MTRFCARMFKWIALTLMISYGALESSATERAKRPVVYVDREEVVWSAPGGTDRMGMIIPGLRYPVLGKYPDGWLIDYEEGLPARVHAKGGLVHLDGDITLVPELATDSSTVKPHTPICGKPVTSPKPKEAERKAREALSTYLRMLHGADYVGAAKYGGTYDNLRHGNPTINPKDYPGLLKYACESLLRCLPVRRILDGEKTRIGDIAFLVEFSDDEGKLFEIGHTLHDGEEEYPNKSKFYFEVKRDCNGTYRVFGLPPYPG